MKPRLVVSLVEFLSLFPGKRWLVPLLALLLGGALSTSAQATQFASGSYTGNGADNRAITGGVGFQPDVVIIKSNTAQLGVMRTATMVGDASKELSAATAFQTNRIQSLDPGGFTVGTNAQVNGNGVTYYWVAFRDDGMGQFRAASYTGNGVDNRSITGVGFTPDYIVVMAEGSKRAVQRSSAMTGDTSFQFDASGPTVNLIQTFNADGFQVGSDARVNTSGSAYHYVAWKATAGTMKAGSYAGNGADNRDITGAGFRPEYVILKSNGNDAAVHRPIGLFSDSTLLFTASTNLSNVIQGLQPDGFQVGSDNRANRSGTTYFWTAFGPELDPVVKLLTITSVNGNTNPTAGTGFQVVVQAQYSGGANINVTTATDVALTLQSGTGTLGGTLTGTIPAGASQVTIDGVSYMKAESGVVLSANATSGDLLAPLDSAPFTVNPGAIYSYTVSFSSPQAAGTSFGVTVTAKDQFANAVTTDNTTVVTLSSSTSHVQFDSNGDGIFGDNTKMLNAGTFTINARDTVPENAAISATDPNGKTGSAPVTINPGMASALAFVVQPGNASAGAAIPGPPTVTVQDSFGNTVTDSTAPITISIGTNPGAGILNGTTTRNAVAGVVGFSDLIINNGGNGYTLAASSSGLTGAATQVFNIYPVVPAPGITSVSPTSGAVGASVTITGSNFGATQGNGIVAFNGTSATPANWSATSIAVPVPTGASTGNVVVNTSGGASNGVSFTVLPTPAITSLSPASGAVGASVTITGTGFGAAQGASTVTFNAAQASPASWSDNQIVVPVPNGASTGNLVVHASGVASNGANFTVVAPPLITSVSPNSGAVGTQVTITGSNFGSTQGSSTVSFNGATLTPTSWRNTWVVGLIPAGATTGNVVVTVGGVASNGLNFTVIVNPVISMVSPTSGAAGTQVTIAGSGFGATQGSGSVWLGSRNGTVASWSDTQIVAAVATGSVSGTARVRQNGIVSNSVSFTISTATITGVTPASGTAGTQVAITGSGFGTIQGSGQVWLGTAPGEVVSWSDGQVMATVASGSTSGSVQILQNGVWSNSMPFTISGAAPRITSITPDRGSPGTAVTIQGTGFGSSQGDGIAWIGGTTGSVESWSDTQVSATVAAGAVSGIVKVQQNGVWSNAVTFTLSSATVTLSPNVLSMVVGETRSIQALNANNQPVTGLTWTCSDTAILSLSADDPPVLTAVAPGNVTVFAGDASADVTVYPGLNLPVGTILWSVPGDFGVIYPAVPSPSGVADVFATKDDGTVLAITADGAVAWSSNVGTDWANSFLPDFQGGLVVYNQSTIYKLDGLTGQAYPAYQASPDVADIGTPAIHTDGTIFTLDYACTDADCSNSEGWLVGIDPSFGTSKFRVPTANSSFHSTATSNDFDRSGNPFCGSGSQTIVLAPTALRNPRILGDGYAYTTYVTYDSSTTMSEAAQPFPVARTTTSIFSGSIQATLSSTTPCVTWRRSGNSPEGHMTH